MNELIDIKYFLLKHKDDNRKLEDTLNDIDNYIKENGFFTADDIKKAFEQGKNSEDNNIISDDTIIDRYRNDETLDNFINYISKVGFFIKKDIDNIYRVGKENIDNDKITGDKLRDWYIDGFRLYLIYKF